MTHHDALPLGVGLFAVWHVAVVLLCLHHRDALRAEGEQRARDREAAQTRAQWYEVAAHLERCRAHFRSLRASLDRPYPAPLPAGNPEGMAAPIPDPAPPPDHAITVCIPDTTTVTLPTGPTARTRDAVVAHKSQALILADYLRATAEPDAMERAAALYANVAAWELWLATEAWGRGDVWVWHGHVVSALSSAVRAGDWARVGEVREYLNTGWRGVEHGAEVRAEILAWAATTEARWGAYRNPPMPPRSTDKYVAP